MPSLRMPTRPHGLCRRKPNSDFRRPAKPNAVGTARFRQFIFAAPVWSGLIQEKEIYKEVYHPKVLGQRYSIKGIFESKVFSVKGITYILG